MIPFDEPIVHRRCDLINRACHYSNDMYIVAISFARAIIYATFAIKLQRHLSWGREMQHSLENRNEIDWIRIEKGHQTGLVTNFDALFLVFLPYFLQPDFKKMQLYLIE